MKKQLCLQCKEPLSGRVDKKFCSEACRSTYHYYHNQDKEDSLFKTIDTIVKLTYFKGIQSGRKSYSEKGGVIG